MPCLPTIPLLSISCLGLKGFLQPKLLGEKERLSPHSPCPTPQAATWPEQTLLEEDEDGGWRTCLSLGILGLCSQLLFCLEWTARVSQCRLCPSSPARAVPGWHSNGS